MTQVNHAARSRFHEDRPMKPAKDPSGQGDGSWKSSAHRVPIAAPTPSLRAPWTRCPGISSSTFAARAAGSGSNATAGFSRVARPPPSCALGPTAATRCTPSDSRHPRPAGAGPPAPTQAPAESPSVRHRGGGFLFFGRRRNATGRGRPRRRSRPVRSGVSTLRRAGSRAQGSAIGSTIQIAHRSHF